MAVEPFRLDEWRREGDGRSAELPPFTRAHLSERQAMGTGGADGLPPHAVYRILLAHSGLPSMPRLVGHTLALHGGNDDRSGRWGRVWPKVATLAHETGADRKTVIKALATLVHEGWLVVEDRGEDGVLYRTKGWPNDYTTTTTTCSRSGSTRCSRRLTPHPALRWSRCRATREGMSIRLGTSVEMCSDASNGGCDVVQFGGCVAHRVCWCSFFHQHVLKSWGVLSGGVQRHDEIMIC